MLFVLAALGYFPGTQAALLVGAVWIVLWVVACLLWVKPAAGQGPPRSGFVSLLI